LMSDESGLSTKATLRYAAISEAVLATAIWASSLVLVKIVLPHMGPLTIAALRYSLAFFLLLPFIVARKRKGMLTVSSRLWIRLFVIGISAYAIGNGALFWGLKYLPATTVSLLMSICPFLILLAGTIWLKEVPTRRQLAGVIIALFGSALFFSPGLRPGESPGIAIVAVGLVGFTAFGILGREIARDKQIDTLSLTAIPLGFGGGVLLLVAFLLEGLPSPTPIAWGLVLWLATVNTAAGYALYNHSLQILTALEMNIILNLAPLGTAVLAWLFLGETLASIQVVGMATVIIGVLLVQRVRAH